MLLVATALLLTAAPQQTNPGQALLDAAALKLRSVKSVTLTLTMTVGTMIAKGPVKIMRGGYVRASTPHYEVIRTPQGGWNLAPDSKQYAKKDAREVADEPSGALPGFEQLFSGAKALKAASGPVAHKMENRNVVRVEVKSISYGGGAPDGTKIYIDLDPQSKLPLDVEMLHGTDSISMKYEDIKLDAGLTTKDFNWSPPSGWTPMKGGNGGHR
ncbi:MAG: hypothetical protein ACHQ50_11475 [Fimbriimonadales bacterium]